MIVVIVLVVVVLNDDSYIDQDGVNALHFALGTSVAPDERTAAVF